MMNRDLLMQNAIPAAIFIALEGLYAAPVIAGDGIVVLQRDVPVRQAVREGVLGRVTSSMDVSPNDKVQQMVDGSQSSLNVSGTHSIGAKSTELGDAEFASVSSGAPQMSGLAVDQSNVAGLTNGQLSIHGLDSSSSSRIAPMITGAVGGAVGGVAGHISGAVAGVTGALSGLTSAIMRSSGQ